MKIMAQISLQVATLLSLSSPLVAFAACPNDIVAFLESKQETNLVKRQTALECSSKRYSLAGEIDDVDSVNAKYTVRIKTGNKNVPFSGAMYEVVLAQQHGCGNLATLKKGDRISMQVRFEKFEGYANRWATGIDALCTPK